MEDGKLLTLLGHLAAGAGVLSRAVLIPAEPAAAGGTALVGFLP